MSAPTPRARRLLRWYAANARPLPWRRVPDPYAVLVSEVMLQQTQVARVVPAWQAFLARFPTVSALAVADRSAVLSAWRGLGYNRRAVNLHEAARVVAERHVGRIPADLDELLALPGVGPYTARAVLAFAYGRDVTPVDTNVARVLVRAVAGEPLGPAALQRLADASVPPGRGRDWGQALMDLGATLCGARRPDCGGCPLRHDCAWAGGPGPDPAARGAARRRPQGTFAGSDRFHRGRLVDALRAGPLAGAHLPRAAALDDARRLRRLVAALEADGLVEWRDGRLCLASTPGAGARR